MPKNNGNNRDYSRDREFTVILESLQSEFKVFGEGLITVQQKVNRLEPLILDLRQEFFQFRSFVQQVLPEVATKDDLKRLEKRLTILEASRS